MVDVHTPLAQLNEALESSLEKDGPALEVRVAVIAGERRYLLAADSLEEVGLVPAISRLGRMPAHVLGLASFRGVPYTLIDASGWLGDAPLEDPEDAWAVLLKDEAVDVALVWPKMTGLFPLGAYTQDPAAPLLPATTRAFLDLNGARWYELDLVTIVNRLRHFATPEFAKENLPS